MKKLMIMAAGTGGHIFPGLAIAQTMRARGWEVSWLGTAHGMETELVPKAGVMMDVIHFSGMRGKGLGHTIGGAFRMLKAFWDCYGIIGRHKPDVVLGMGGYVTVPGGLTVQDTLAAADRPAVARPVPDRQQPARGHTTDIRARQRAHEADATARRFVTVAGCDAVKLLDATPVVSMTVRRMELPGAEILAAA